MGRSYDQFCGLARAAEVVGERWTLLILRDLSVGPASFTELRTGLPGIAATMLSTRLRDLEDAGLVARHGRRHGAVYALSPRGQDIVPALTALSLWGASTMEVPRDNEVVTDRSLAAMLVSSRTSDPVRPFTVAVRAPSAQAYASVTRTSVTATPGESSPADLTIEGPGLRSLLAHTRTAHDLIERAELSAQGDPSLLEDFTRAFSAPLTVRRHPRRSVDPKE